MSVADDIKRVYVRPAICLDETEWLGPKGHQHARFWIEETVWLDAKLPSYRVAIPEDTSFSEPPRSWDAIETRFVEYEPTGRIIYDNSLPPARAVVWEYRLKHSRDLVTK